MSAATVERYSDSGDVADASTPKLLKTPNLRYENRRLWNIYLSFAVKRILKGTSPETLKAMREAYLDYQEKLIEEEEGIFSEDYR